MQVDNIFGPVDIAISGLRAQQKQIDVISSNVSNARTTDAGKGEPYRRREALFRTEDEEITGVSLDRIVTDQSDFYKVFEPSHPNADESGYVAMPNVNLPTEMINLAIATRTYQANAAILRRYQQMVETTLELLR
jgi:flagellar basal-body rod protein FlgC